MAERGGGLGAHFRNWRPWTIQGSWNQDTGVLDSELTRRGEWMRVFSGRTDPGKERTALISDGELIGDGERTAWIAGGMDRGRHERLPRKSY